MSRQRRTLTVESVGEPDPNLAAGALVPFILEILHRQVAQESEPPIAPQPPPPEENLPFIPQPQPMRKGITPPDLS